jgi:GGDEF domain-containing protein/uncharacterized PurR-regulated membrane protein YhhQ (DUF165 family)
MDNAALILILEAMFMYFLVLGAHALRHRFGLSHFYALLGGITAIMSWVTDAGLAVEVVGVTFVVGSTVFYTTLMLGAFVVYVFDGPQAARVAISTIIIVSVLMPLVAATLHLQTALISTAPLTNIPQPSLRINAASVFTTLLDLIFLGIAWEFLGRPDIGIRLWMRTYLTLLGVMWLDVLLFTTGAFSGTPDYLSIMQGTLVSRLILSLFALPFLYGYLYWQKGREDVAIPHRPALAILQRVAQMEMELTRAQNEIERRKQAEREKQRVIEELQQSREEYQKLSAKLQKTTRTNELTGVANRRYFNEVLEREWKRAIREGTTLSLLIMDVDHFKAYNDNYGHLAGDSCLKRLADELSQYFRRPADLFARFGGDEFAAILPRTDRAGAMSIGVSSASPDRDYDADEIVRDADRALYEAKQRGRGRVASP